MAGRSPKFQTKKIKFNGQELTLYSLDGATWSSRKAELSEIHDRREDNRVTFEEIRSGIVQKKGGSKESSEEKKAEVSKKEELPKPKKRTTSKKATSKKTSSAKKTKSSKAA